MAEGLCSGLQSRLCRFESDSRLQILTIPSHFLDLFNRLIRGARGNLAPMPEFATLMLRASEAFGAPAQLARVLGQDSHDVYRWIAGVEAPAKAKCEQLAELLRTALAERGVRPAPQRRWSDRRKRR